MIVHARAYVGSPCAAHAMMAIVAALNKHELIKEPLPEADVARKEKHRQREACHRPRRAARDGPRQPASRRSATTLPQDVFAPELDYMILENMYFDLWARTEVLSPSRPAAWSPSA